MNAYQRKLSNDTVLLSVWDARDLKDDEVKLIYEHGAHYIDSKNISLNQFINDQDYVVVSPGVNVNSYLSDPIKLRCELDFFSEFFKKPSIAITGSFGKTTVTKLMGKLLGNYRNVCVGGNGHRNPLDIIQDQENCDFAVLELSSFQLELNRTYAPDLAIWTNWHPNHLDRHATARDYFDAKLNLLRFQNNDQKALLYAGLFIGNSATWMYEVLPDIPSNLNIYTDTSSDSIIKTIQLKKYTLFSVEQNQLVVSTVTNGVVVTKNSILNLSHLPDITFLQNWIAVLSGMYLLGIDVLSIPLFIEKQHDSLLENHHHRLEHCGTVNGTDFYNDSKSTVIQTTQAAFEKLTMLGRPIILIVGGLSKGIDRSVLERNVTHHHLLKKMICFGSDCATFSYCEKYPTLESTVEAIKKIMVPGDIVLFSPAGSSFDLFKNYEHRGDVFKQLVKTLDK